MHHGILVVYIYVSDKLRWGCTNNVFRALFRIVYSNDWRAHETGGSPIICGRIESSKSSGWAHTECQGRNLKAPKLQSRFVAQGGESRVETGWIMWYEV